LSRHRQSRDLTNRIQKSIANRTQQAVKNHLTGVGAAVGLGVGTCVGACSRNANDHPKRMSFDAYGQVQWP